MHLQINQDYITAKYHASGGNEDTLMLIRRIEKPENKNHAETLAWVT